MRRVPGLPRAAAAALAGFLIAACTATQQPSPASRAGATRTAAATPTSTGQGSGSAAPTGTPSQGTPARPGQWGNAADVPGIAKLNAGLEAQVLAVSCPSAGNCAVGGFYSDATVKQQAFVDTERHGTWSAAFPVPGIQARNTGGKAQVNAVSCASPGNCAAVGYYTDFASGLTIPFVAEEKDDAWGSVQPVPGITSLAGGGNAQLTAVSCPSAGNCGAGGYYSSTTGTVPSFVVTEAGYHWGTARGVTGTGAYPGTGTGQQGGLATISCASAGNCVAGGSYADANGDSQGFVATETAGTWGAGLPEPGKPGSAVESVSCAATGYCLAGGMVSAGPVSDGFVVAQTRGEWGRPLVLKTTGAVSSVSCASAGDCAAGGATGSGTGFLISEVGGSWHAPHVITLSGAQVTAISCRMAGYCAAVGTYLSGSSATRAGFVVSQSHGTWGTAAVVPGTAKLSTTGAPVITVSCGSAGNCSAGGYYFVAGGAGYQAFVVTMQLSRRARLHRADCLGHAWVIPSYSVSLAFPTGVSVERSAAHRGDGPRTWRSPRP